ncbi:MAG: hypothetical protein KDI36_12605 [Pseudomonadales bacterium]|nr:hypothetical protein [Pseudomonadales bacterium]
MESLILPLSLTAGLLASSLVPFFIRSASTLSPMCIANGRSSHTYPTPLGLGWLIAPFILGSWFLCNDEWSAVAPILGTVVLSVGMLLLGGIDDLYDVNALLKLLIQSALVLAVLTLVVVAPLRIGPFTELSITGTFLAAGLLMVGTINTHNFMDGINGLAIIQFVFYSFGSAFFLWEIAPSTASLMFAAGVVSLMVTLWNFPFARIFLGDSGSGFQGALVAITLLVAVSLDSSALLELILLYSAFYIDAFCTLFSRMIAGRNCFRPHRQHLYQRAFDRWGAVVVVSLFVIWDLLVALPAAWLVSQGVSWIVVPSVFATGAAIWLVGTLLLSRSPHQDMPDANRSSTRILAGTH